MDGIGFLTEVMAAVAASEPRFASLRRVGLRTYPIPFFGRIDTATVLTVGVNPSPGEFEGGRWPNDADPRDVFERLIRYFESRPPAHAWFDDWQAALRPLEVSYQSGQVAHIDVSPRATIPMRQVQEIDLFRQMTTTDVKWLFRLLSLLERPRLALLAGCVTKNRYMIRFLRECAPQHGFRILGEEQNHGPGRVGYHAFEWSGGRIPAFFTSVSPSGSAEEKRLLADRVNEHAHRLRLIIRGEHPGWTSDRHMQLTALVPAG